MLCVIHKYNGSGPCDECLEIILEKHRNGKLTPVDLPLVKELQKWIDAKIAKELGLSFK